MSLNFKNKQLRLTDGRFIGVAPHHINKTGSHDVWRWHDMCITTDDKRAVICSYDGNFIESQQSDCTEAGLALDLSHWRYSKENTVNLVKHFKNGCRQGGGGRDFQIDPTSGKIFLKPLVLGKRADGTVELVAKDDSRALKVSNLNKDNDEKFSHPQFLELVGGAFIGRKWDDKRQAGEWSYIDLCVTNDQNKAVKCTYDGQFITTDYQGDMTFDLSCWSYRKGNHLVCVNGPNAARTRLGGGGRDFCFYPDGQIGMKPLALGQKNDSDRLVLLDPDSEKVLKFDLDYLLSESFIEVKNRTIQELENLNQKLNQEKAKLLEEKERNEKEKENKSLKLKDGRFINMDSPLDGIDGIGLVITENDERRVHVSYQNGELQFTDNEYNLALLDDWFEPGQVGLTNKNKHKAFRKFDIDPQTGKVLVSPLVLGKRESDGTIELVAKDDPRALRIQNLVSTKYFDFQLLELRNGEYIGKKSNEKTVYKDDWECIDLCVTNDKSKALNCSYDGHFIQTFEYGVLNAVFGLYDWNYELGNHIVSLNSNQGKSAKVFYDLGDGIQRKATDRGFYFYPDGQIGMQRLALGKNWCDNGLAAVDVNSPEVIQLDLDFLKVDKETEKVNHELIEELKAKNEKLAQENKGLKDELSYKKQVERLAADNMKLKSMMNKLKGGEKNEGEEAAVEEKESPEEAAVEEKESPEEAQAEEEESQPEKNYEQANEQVINITIDNSNKN